MKEKLLPELHIQQKPSQGLTQQQDVPIFYAIDGNDELFLVTN